MNIDLAAVLVFLLALTVAIVALYAALLLAQIARASVAGHVPGTGSHAGGGRAGEGKSTTHSEESPKDSIALEQRLLRLKRELLEQWAKEGKPIDVVTEAKAEIVALEIEERAGAWRDFVASAADEPLEPERPFAS